jgi:hypothetical protein
MSMEDGTQGGGLVSKELWAGKPHYRIKWSVLVAFTSEGIRNPQQAYTNVLHTRG